MAASDLQKQLDALNIQLSSSIAEGDRLWAEFSNTPIKHIDKRLSRKKAAKKQDAEVKRIRDLIEEVLKKQTEQIGLEKGIDTVSNKLQGISSIVTASGSAIGAAASPFMGEFGLLGKGAASIAATKGQVQTNRDLIKADEPQKVNSFFGFNSLGVISSQTWLIVCGVLVVILLVTKKKR